jgi:hypothetical protein
MRRTLLAATLAAVVAAPLGAAVVIPADGFAPGWVKSEAQRTFGGNRLFDHIDGGAELYLEFGFRTLAYQRYAKGEDELVLEVYEMIGPESALGLYLMKCGVETPQTGIASRNSSEAAQFTILKGRYFLHINNASGGEDLVPAMTALANRALETVPDERPADLLSMLPAEGLVPGSAVLFRGPVGLQAVFTLGEGDILEQRGDVFGVSGAYEEPLDGRFSVILVAYPDSARAAAAYAGLEARLDPYLTIIQKGESAFVFKDFKKEYGRAELKVDRIEIRVGLVTPPALWPTLSPSGSWPPARSPGEPPPG